VVDEFGAVVSDPSQDGADGKLGTEKPNDTDESSVLDAVGTKLTSESESVATARIDVRSGTTSVSSDGVCADATDTVGCSETSGVVFTPTVWRDDPAGKTNMTTITIAAHAAVTSEKTIVRFQPVGLIRSAVRAMTSAERSPG